MKKEPAASVFGWLKSNLGKRCLAPLTGSDAPLIVEIHAGAAYVDAVHWRTYLERGVLYRTPLAGTGIGAQLTHYARVNAFPIDTHAKVVQQVTTTADAAAPSHASIPAHAH